MAYPFLSDEWEAEARAIRSAYDGRVTGLPLSIRLNINVTKVPFGDAVLHARVDTSGGGLEIESGHLDTPDVTVTIDYGTARGIIVGGDPQAVLMAFLGGRIKVDGDITKLLELQSSGALGGDIDPVVGEVYDRIRAITE